MATTSEQSSTLLHKIVIPVITIMLGATAIYFLAFNKKPGLSEAEKEEATVNAWQSFVSSQNINYKNTLSLTDEYKEKLANETTDNGIEGLVPVLRSFQDELSRESDKANEDIEAILKDDNIDEEFISMLKRAFDNGKDQGKKVNIFFDGLISLAKSNLDEQTKKEKWGEEGEKFIAMGNKMEERAATEAEDIAKTLSKKYNRLFDLNELLVYVEYKKEKEKKGSR